MAYTDNAPRFSLEAGANLTQFTFITIDSNGKAATAAAQAAADGVALNNPASGDAVEVAYGGLTQVLAGEPITQGEDVSVGSGSKAITAAGASGDAIVGRAVTASSGDGSVITIHFLPRATVA